MALNLNTIYQNLLGRPVDAGGLAHWTNDYNTYIGTGPGGGFSHDEAVNKIKSNIKLHDEYTVNDILANNPAIVDTIDKYDIHGLSNDAYVDETKWNTMMGNFSTLKDDYGSLKDELAKNQQDLMKAFANASWGGGGGSGQTVGGVKTQNELPGWAPKTGGSSGFFGRGGNRFGLTTSSLNI